MKLSLSLLLHGGIVSLALAAPTRPQQAGQIVAPASVIDKRSLNVSTPGHDLGAYFASIFDPVALHASLLDDPEAVIGGLKPWPAVISPSELQAATVALSHSIAKNSTEQFRHAIEQGWPERDTSNDTHALAYLAYHPEAVFKFEQTLSSVIGHVKAYAIHVTFSNPDANSTELLGHIVGMGSSASNETRALAYLARHQYDLARLEGTLLDVIRNTQDDSRILTFSNLNANNMTQHYGNVVEKRAPFSYCKVDNWLREKMYKLFGKPKHPKYHPPCKREEDGDNVERADKARALAAAVALSTWKSVVAGPKYNNVSVSTSLPPMQSGGYPASSAVSESTDYVHPTDTAVPAPILPVKRSVTTIPPRLYKGPHGPYVQPNETAVPAPILPVKRSDNVTVVTPPGNITDPRGLTDSQLTRIAALLNATSTADLIIDATRIRALSVKDQVQFFNILNEESLTSFDHMTFAQAILASTIVETSLEKLVFASKKSFDEMSHEEKIEAFASVRNFYESEGLLVAAAKKEEPLRERENAVNCIIIWWYQCIV